MVVQEVIVVRLWLPTVEVSSSKTADRIRTAEKNDRTAIRKIITLPRTALMVERICYTIWHEADWQLASMSLLVFAQPSFLHSRPAIVISIVFRLFRTRTLALQGSLLVVSACQHSRCGDFLSCNRRRIHETVTRADRPTHQLNLVQEILPEQESQVCPRGVPVDFSQRNGRI